MKKLIIIPAYNEADNLIGLVNEICTKAPSYDYVIVNDGSKDNTAQLCQEKGLNALHLHNNLGIGGAVQTGYIYAQMYDYDIAIQLDGDGQHDPIYLDKIIQPILDNQADFVIGSRYIDKEGFQSSGIRRLGINWFNRIIIKLTGIHITDATSGFRAANREVIKRFSDYYPIDYPEPESITDLCRFNLRVMEIPVTMRERQSGQSSIRFLKPIYYMMKVTLAILIAQFKPREGK